MRITGHAGAIQYLKCCPGEFEEEDLDVAMWIGDEYLEWDTDSETIWQTHKGKLFFHSGTMH